MFQRNNGVLKYTNPSEQQPTHSLKDGGEVLTAEFRVGRVLSTALNRNFQNAKSWQVGAKVWGTADGGCCLWAVFSFRIPTAKGTHLTAELSSYLPVTQ